MHFVQLPTFYCQIPNAVDVGPYPTAPACRTKPEVLMKNIIGTIAFTLMAVGGPALAQSYPEKAVTLVVPYGPGGASDLAGRALSSQVYGSQTFEESSSRQSVSVFLVNINWPPLA